MSSHASSTVRVFAHTQNLGSGEADGVHETSLPPSVGGYRIGRRLAEGRYLGHALAPTLVELVFLDELSGEEQRRVCSDAQDFSSLPDGGRVAILARKSTNDETPDRFEPVQIRLTTPPDLIESWRHMEEVTAAASTTPDDAANDADTLRGRVRGLLKRARRGPVVLAVVAGVATVLVVVLLFPTTPQSNVATAGASLISTTDAATETRTRSSTELSTELNTESSTAPQTSAGPTPTPTQPDFLTPSEPLLPLSSLGDFILVRVPARSGHAPGDIAVLERSGDSWIVRETYPENSQLG